MYLIFFLFEPIWANIGMYLIFFLLTENENYKKPGDSSTGTM